MIGREDHLIAVALPTFELLVGQKMGVWMENVHRNHFPESLIMFAIDHETSRSLAEFLKRVLDLVVVAIVREDGNQYGEARELLDGLHII